MNKKNFMGILLGFCLILVIGLGVGYFIGHDSLKENPQKNKKEESTIIDDNKENTEDKLTKEELDALGKELYSKVNIYQSSPIKYYYLFSDYSKNIDSIINYAMLENDAKFGATIASISNLDLNLDCQTENCSVYELDYNVFLDSYHKLFGTKNSFNYQKDNYYKDYLGNDCLIDTKITCNLPQDGDDSSIIPYIVYDYSEESNEDIIVYVKGYFVNLDEDIYYSHKNSNIVNYSNQYKEEDMLNNYKEQLDTYKVTFKKDTNSNYYWYQTELI